MRAGIATSLTFLVLLAGSPSVPGTASFVHAEEDISARQVLTGIKRARRYLVGKQNRDGSWTMDGGALQHRTGVTALAVLALLNSGSDMEDPSIAGGVKFLREAEPSGTYEIALVASALAAAKDGVRDKGRLLALANKLQDFQIKAGANAGSWGYAGEQGSGDNSNSQYAILGLRDCAEAGIPVRREVWEKAQKYWIAAQTQGNVAGWGYGRGGGSETGSMTVAGISSLSITTRMLRDHTGDLQGGQLNCCGNDAEDPAQKALEKAYEWMGRNGSAKENPGPGGMWYLYYMYGLERAGRLSGKRLFGTKFDWYREGAGHLLGPRGQNAATGAFHGVGGRGGWDNDPVLGTSFALLFLAKGLSPVMVNKLQYPVDTPRGLDREKWDAQHDDARNLVDHVSGLPKWPKLVTSQTVDVEKLTEETGVADLLQAPVLYITGREAPKFSDRQVEILRKYVEQGGFVFAVNGGSNVCGENGAAFESALYELVDRMFERQAELKRLPPEHPVYRAERRLPDDVELRGVDYGCRTVLVYAPKNALPPHRTLGDLPLPCLWNMWQRQQPRERQLDVKIEIEKAVAIGVNVLAYATGREPPVKLATPDVVAEEGRNEIERGFLQIAKIRHTGGWDAAPRALTRLLTTLNRTVGTTASTKQRVLTFADPNVFNYPILYMHGRNDFRLNEAERRQLKTYVERGGLLFADACCGAPTFDQSFRTEIEKALGAKLRRIPVDHEIFTDRIGHDIRKVRRRAPLSDNPNRPLDAAVEEVSPILEAIEIDGRIAVVYSKYDISCALEQQASVACAGYVPEDAARIAVNVVLYGMLQDAKWREIVEEWK